MIDTRPVGSSSESLDELSIRARNITGTQDLALEVRRGLPAGELTRSIADLMSLPDDTTWVLRNDDSSAFLDNTRSIGEQIAPGARLTVTPQSHLG